MSREIEASGVNVWLNCSRLHSSDMVEAEECGIFSADPSSATLSTDENGMVSKDQLAIQHIFVTLWCSGLAPHKCSFVLLQCLLEALYLILLSVLYLIQFGRGRFALIFLAICTFLVRLLIDPIFLLNF